MFANFLAVKEASKTKRIKLTKFKNAVGLCAKILCFFYHSKISAYGFAFV